MIPIAQLLRRPGPGRRRQAAAVQAQLREARRRPQNAEIQQLAEQAGALRDELSELVGCGRACASCAVSQPLPKGAYAGGRCCAGTTADVFMPVEIALLAARGVRSADLAVPREPDRGCAFLGPTGCSLAPRARPTICIHYICRELMAELADRGVARRVGDLREQLAGSMKQLAAAVERRDEQDAFDAVFAEALQDHE